VKKSWEIVYTKMQCAISKQKSVHVYVVNRHYVRHVTIYAQRQAQHRPITLLRSF